MTTYDPQIIQKFVDRLYKEATTTVVTSPILGILIGGGAGLALGGRSPNLIWALIGAVIVGLIGYWVGQERAFQLKLQAQTALCQIKIEENTRK